MEDRMTQGQSLRMRVEETRNVLYEAIRSLAGFCDGAATRDGVGFNKYDSEWGRDLALEDCSEWDLAKCVRVQEFVHKYRRQLSEVHGVELSELVNLEDFASNFIDFDRNRFMFVFGYNMEIVAEIKRTWGKHNCQWNKAGRKWEVRVSESVARKVLDFADKWSLSMSDEAQREVDRLIDRLARFRKQPWMVNEEIR
jgi:hypothetical protein